MGSTYKDLKVWQKAIELAREVYKLTACFPTEEKYGLCSQLRRAAISISANLAEGQGRGTRRDYTHFVSIALGSAREVESLLIVSIELGIASPADASDCNSLTDEIGRMLYSLRSRLLENSKSV